MAQRTICVILEKEEYNAVVDPVELIKLANQICINLVRNWRRGPDRRPVTPPSNLYTLATADNWVLRREVKDAIEQSGERCRKLLALKVSGCSTTDICAELGVGRNVLDQRYFNCVQKLKKILGAQQ